MIHLRTDFFSETLGLSTSMTVLLPQAAAGQVGMSGRVRADGHPVLYLLHGSSDDDTTWLRRTSLERYAAELGLAVVMPQVHLSFYCDEAYGLPYWTFLTEELPALVTDTFRVSSARDDTFVAGLSMGGFGAFKWALHHPERFAAAASLSGALDLAGLRWEGRDPKQRMRIWGRRKIAGSHDDLLHVLDGVDPAALPALYVTCGTEDFLHDDNRRFVTAAEQHGIPLTTDFRPGAHEWGYWDAAIQRVLDWLPIANPAPAPVG
ncbi:MAG TPA: alpha/beta hydrolase family protein [Segeticoccus sp.]|uniref:alpha/beta hydrolase n=1 Tax=Segeticoccus sp. TaxID=2706531 RepID=UPI002D7E1C82|nr:alpha/beta hydrolase family protein [Segeticoccus sp.]HET8600011.1 alpha/beta hydrolase family protein [Segeticoccus sp.]